MSHQQTRGDEVYDLYCSQPPGGGWASGSEIYFPKVNCYLPQYKLFYLIMVIKYQQRLKLIVKISLIFIQVNKSDQDHLIPGCKEKYSVWDSVHSCIHSRLLYLTDKLSDPPMTQELPPVVGPVHCCRLAIRVCVCWGGGSPLAVPLLKLRSQAEVDGFTSLMWNFYLLWVIGQALLFNHDFVRSVIIVPDQLCS